MGRDHPADSDLEAELFARRVDESEPRRRRRRRRLDARFACYLIHQIAPVEAPAPIATAAAYRAVALDLSRPRKGVLANEQA